MKNSKLYKRQQNWKRYQYLHNQDKTLCFMCQCGKKYVNFPGLYLHCQKKHKHKISTKFNQQQCQITQNDGKITYRFMFSQKLNQKQEQTFPSERSYVMNVLLKFCSEQEQCLSNYLIQGGETDLTQLTKKILADFQSFLFQIFEQSQQAQGIKSKQIVQTIPNYLNSFMDKTGLESSSAIYKQICIILFKMCQWLKQFGYTELVVELTA